MRANLFPVKRRLWTGLFWLHVTAAVLATLQRLIAGSQVNNYRIFRSAFWHLVRGQDLYVLYPADHFDLYKYSPTFALLMAPFAILPVGIGLLLWNVTNAVALAWALRALLGERGAALALAVCFLEALGSIQNAQSNGLVAGLIIATMVAVERRQEALGAGAVVIGTGVKMFPAAAGLFGVAGPRPWRFIGWSAVWAAVLSVLPLAVTSPTLLRAQYASWLRVQAQDRLQTHKMWIGGILEAFGFEPRAVLIQVAGVAVMLASAWIVRRLWDRAEARALLVASLLLFTNIFNHMAELPSYVIGYAGVGIWWAVMPRARWRDGLMLIAVLGGSLAATDILPGAVRKVYFGWWQAKAVVCTLVWLAIQWDLFCLARSVPQTASGPGRQTLPGTAVSEPLDTSRRVEIRS